MILTLACFLTICLMTVTFYGCNPSLQAQDLMAGIIPRAVATSTDLSKDNVIVSDFAVRLFNASYDKSRNTLISPLSVLCALAMTANGAEGETLSQMETVLGMKSEELNSYLYTYMKNLPQGEKYKLNLANSIWFTDRHNFTVNQDFLQTNADYYGADIYQAPFDKSTLKDINNWVKINTDEMIPKILDEIPYEAVMYLVNALAFEAEWTEIYEKHQVQNGFFTNRNGVKQNAEFMYSSERTYLEDENAIGFIKYYKGGKYAFVAMLPNEEISVAEYINSLDGESLNALLSKSQNLTVNTAIPKFKTQFTTEMSEVLKTMGIRDAFDVDIADFRNLGTAPNGNIFISRVLHKTIISVGEKGTKAGASTVVEMGKDTSAPNQTKPKQVYLDRPFVYMLIDCENNIPFFIGTMLDIKL